jgi:outer membrane protein assembly factor BamD
MNRFVIQISVIGLCVALSASAYGIGSKKKRQHKLNTSNPLADVKSKQPDKELYDKAMIALKKGKFDVARLDLQVMLNTYPDSEYQMRAKLAVGDTWYKEGGSAALTQAESEYKDFITFFPNAPEAAEAQMKVGDIYYQQMEKPDRDHTNVERAEAEYRTMIQQFPDSQLVPRAKQRLREVQEVLAQREYEIGAFYSTHENWPATIARLQTVEDTYPLFSHSDMALLTLGDAYATEARVASGLNIPAKAKETLMRVYNDEAAVAWSRVVTRYPMAPHVEDAKDRLIAMNRPVPEPTHDQLAESEAEEQSRINVKLKDKAMLLVKHGPSTVDATRVGEPTLADPSPTFAPNVSKATVAAFNAAVAGKPVTTVGNAANNAAITNGVAPPRTEQPASPSIRLENVPDTSNGNGVGAQIISAPSGTGDATANPNGAAGEGVPGAVAPAGAAPTADPNANGGLKAVGPPDQTPLPPIEKPAEAAEQKNDVPAGGAAQVSTGTTASGKKAPKVPYDASKDSSSKHKKKKGLDKVNPF